MHFFCPISGNVSKIVIFDRRQHFRGSPIPSASFSWRLSVDHVSLIMAAHIEHCNHIRYPRPESHLFVVQTIPSLYYKQYRVLKSVKIYLSIYWASIDCQHHYSSQIWAMSWTQNILMPCYHTSYISIQIFHVSSIHVRHANYFSSILSVVFSISAQMRWTNASWRSLFLAHSSAAESSLSKCKDNENLALALCSWICSSKFWPIVSSRFCNLLFLSSGVNGILCVVHGTFHISSYLVFFPNSSCFHSLHLQVPSIPFFRSLVGWEYRYYRLSRPPPNASLVVENNRALVYNTFSCSLLTLQ